MHNKTYNAGIYLRLSKEDETGGQSESIENQKNFIVNYIQEHKWNIVHIYADDGYSGLNFDRPDFQKMLQDIETQKINLVITKDLSRLGRDYIDTGYYLERYFPAKNVRYIAINDGIDTADKHNNNDLSPFKSVINDMYAKDISKKVRSVIDTKRKQGKFIGAFAPYGYRKDPIDKNQLIIDKNAALIVTRIYRLYLQDNNMSKIAALLNAEEVPCPSKYKLATGNYKNVRVKQYQWNQETIKRILTNPTYAGCMTQHRQEKINYKLKKTKKIPQKEWITVNNTHEAIIQPDMFQTVQNIIQNKSVQYTRTNTKPHLLNGLVFCKECGAKMTYRRNSSGAMTMNCLRYIKSGPTACSSHTISEALVETRIIADLKRIAEYSLSETFYNQLQEIHFPVNDTDAAQHLCDLHKRLSEIRSLTKALYEDKVNGVISPQDFLELTAEYRKEKARLNHQHAVLLQKQEEHNQIQRAGCFTLLKQLFSFDVTNKLVLSHYIERIEISKNRDIYIYYTFQDPLAANSPIMNESTHAPLLPQFCT